MNSPIFVTIFVALIVAGRYTIENTPPNLKDAVLVELAALGLDGYGKPLQTPETVEGK